MNDVSTPSWLSQFVTGLMRSNAQSQGIEIPAATYCRQNHKLRRTLLNLQLVEGELLEYLSEDEHRAFKYAITQVTDAIRGTPAPK